MLNKNLWHCTKNKIFSESLDSIERHIFGSDSVVHQCTAAKLWIRS